MILKTKAFGLTLNIVLTLAIVVTFWGSTLKDINNTYFATSGDGLKDYFAATYVVKHDTSYWHSNAMNYPYGENIMFTGSQLWVAHSVKLISYNIVDISDYVVGIINFSMIFSLLLGSLFLYLLLTHFKLPYLYSAIVAIGITFLSPQIGRMGGHFSLSYVFAIPAILYFTAKFYELPRYSISLVMGLFMLWAVGSHVYLLGFYAFIVLIYWVAVIFIFKNIDLKRGILHFSIQFLFPLIIFLTVVSLTDNVTDRTSYPWGFLNLRATLEGIFLPLGRPYARFIYTISDFRYVEWESIAFVGLVGLLGTIYLLVRVSKSLFAKRFTQILWPKDNYPMMNLFIWVSLISLFYSFGLPFRLGLQGLIDYIGPLKQMRGIARFSWIFFYVINIYIFYIIWNIKYSKLNKYLWIMLVAFSTTFLLYDAWYNTRFWSGYLNNKVPSISDTQNQLPNNKWVSMIDTSRYQAVIPIPYFHIGSENIWVDAQQNITSSVYSLGWKTGMPCMGVMMSRTSISQTLANLQLVWEPYRKPEVLSKLKSTKDLLILSKEKDTYIPDSQRALLAKSKPLYQSDEFNLYVLPFDSLESSFNNLYSKELQKFDTQQLHQHGEYFSTTSNNNFYVDNFAEEQSDVFYIDGGSKSQRFRPKRMFYKKTIENPVSDQEVEYVLSFWVYDIQTDLMLRSQIIVEVADANGANYFYEVHSLGQTIKLVDGKWGLIETNFKVRKSGDIMGFWLSNWDLRRKNYIVDQVMIRPTSTIVYRKTDNWIMRNNRFFFK